MKNVFSKIIPALILLATLAGALHWFSTSSNCLGEPVAVDRDLSKTKLSWDSGTATMLNQPSEQERRNGTEALKIWKSLSGKKRAEAAMDILIGKSLVGMYKSDIKTHLGNPSPINTVEPQRWCFDCTLDGEDWRYLMIDFDKQDKVSDVFLLLNH